MREVRPSDLSQGDTLIWSINGAGVQFGDFRPFLNAGGDIILSGGSSGDFLGGWVDGYFNTIEPDNEWYVGQNPLTLFGDNIFSASLPSPHSFPQSIRRWYMRTFRDTPNTEIYAHIREEIDGGKVAIGAFRGYPNGGSFNLLSLVFGNRDGDEAFIRLWLEASLKAAVHGIDGEDEADTLVAAAFDPPAAGRGDWEWLGNSQTLLAQTFTATQTGRAHEIDFLFGRIDGRRAPAAIEVSIWEAAGEPARSLGSVIASVNLVDDEYLSFNVSLANIRLIAGQEYAIVVHPPTDGGSMRAIGASGGFGDGRAFQSRNNGVTWSPVGEDFGFAVTVETQKYETLIDRGSLWSYLDDGSDQSEAWREAAYDDRRWSRGRAPLGYGDPVATTLSFGPRSDQKFITTYFRKRFAVDSPELIDALKLGLRRDDGAKVYINGEEVARSNMPRRYVRYRSLAESSIGGAAETEYVQYTLPATTLVPGVNVIAVELHQASEDSSDLLFDLSLETVAKVTERVDLVLSTTRNQNVVGAPDSVTHTVTLQNLGPSDASSVEIDLDHLFPFGVTQDSPVVSAGDVANDQWMLNLAENQTATLQVTYHVSSNAMGGIDVLATSAAVSSLEQPLTNMEDDSTSISSSIVSPADIGLLEIDISPNLELQSGLFTQEITITNDNPLPLAGFRLLIVGLPDDGQVYNAHVTTSGGAAIIDSNNDLGVGESVTLTIEFHRPNLDPNFTPTYSIEAAFAEDPPEPAVAPAGSAIDRMLILGSGDILVEFTTTPGAIYAIEYSHDMQIWHRVVPSITANANRAQWIDSGPPKTISHPSSVDRRYYRVVTLQN